MRSFVIRETGKPPRTYRIDQPLVIIGRAEDVQLVLPNVSVSRNHARVVQGADGLVLEDLESQNGTTVNGKVVKTHPLRHGDQVQIGKYLLAFHDDEIVKRARATGPAPEILPNYEAPDALANANSTVALSIGELKRQRELTLLREDARVVTVEAEKRTWVPGERELQFGGDGGIKLRGTWSWGAVATLKWDGTAHVLERKAWLTGVIVNGVKVDRQPLKPGDTFQMGSSVFRYLGPLQAD